MKALLEKEMSLPLEKKINLWVDHHLNVMKLESFLFLLEIVMNLLLPL